MYINASLIKPKVLTRLACGFLLAIFFSGCQVKDIELIEVESVEVLNIKDGNINAVITLKLMNPNWFGVKVKAAEFEIWANSSVMGYAKLSKPFKIASNASQSYDVELSGNMSQALSGGISSMIGMLMGNDPKIIIKGDLKVSSFMVSKNVSIEEETDMKLSSLIR